MLAVAACAWPAELGGGAGITRACRYGRRLKSSGDLGGATKGAPGGKRTKPNGASTLGTQANHRAKHGVMGIAEAGDVNRIGICIENVAWPL